MESVDKWDKINPSSVDTIPTVVWPLPDRPNPLSFPGKFYFPEKIKRERESDQAFIVASVVQ